LMLADDARLPLLDPNFHWSRFPNFHWSRFRILFLRVDELGQSRLPTPGIRTRPLLPSKCRHLAFRFHLDEWQMEGGVDAPLELTV
jgi:hypothetical protein